MRGGGRGECSATQYQPSDDTDEVLLRSRFKVELGVVPGADSEAVLGEGLEEAPGADSAVEPGAHQGAGEVSAGEGLAAVEGVSESLAGCTCFASYRLFLCFLSSCYRRITAVGTCTISIHQKRLSRRISLGPMRLVGAS